MALATISCLWGTTTTKKLQRDRENMPLQSIGGKADPAVRLKQPGYLSEHLTKEIPQK